MRIETVFPKRFVIPKVFTDRDTKIAAIDLKELSLRCRLKVTRIIEDVVLRQ